MKRNRMLTLCITCFLLCSLFSCEKISSIQPGSAHKQANYSVERNEFFAKGYDKQFIENFGDTAKLYWEPIWRAGFTRRSKAGVSNTFIPVKPLLRSNKNLRWRDNYHSVDTRRFILVRTENSQTTFYSATYLADGKQGQDAAIAAAQPFRLSSFSGILLLQNLTTADRYQLTYKEGAYIKNPAPTKTKNGDVVGGANSYDCQELYICDWTAVCYRYDGNYAIYGTTTHSYSGCVEPGQDACPDVSGRSWYETGRRTEAYCIWTGDNPGDNGDNSGGGGTGGDDTGDDHTGDGYDETDDTGDGYNYGGTTNYEIADTECWGLTMMVWRISVTGGLETGAYHTTSGKMILLPSVYNTPVSVNITFPYRDAQGRIIISGPYLDDNNNYLIDLTDYSTGIAVISTYTISYFVHSHPVGPNYYSNLPSPEDMANATRYPGMRHRIVNEEKLVDYDSNGVIINSIVPNTFCK